MQRLLSGLREDSDIVLVDTPPTLAVTDAAVVVPTVNGVLGVVLNDVDLRGKPYTYNNHYYRNYST